MTAWHNELYFFGNLDTWTSAIITKNKYQVSYFEPSLDKINLKLSTKIFLGTKAPKKYNLKVPQELEVKQYSV